MDKNESGRVKILFVDDRSKRIHHALVKYADFDCRIAPNVKEALRLISHENWDVVSLDYDLNGDDFQDPCEKTSGMEIIRYIEKYGWPHNHVPQFVIHSSNAFVSQAMVAILIRKGYDAGYYPYNYELGIEWAKG